MKKEFLHLTPEERALSFIAFALSLKGQTEAEIAAKLYKPPRLAKKDMVPSTMSKDFPIVDVTLKGSQTSINAATALLDEEASDRGGEKYLDSQSQSLFSRGITAKCSYQFTASESSHPDIPSYSNN